jgi:hypothetical protein
MLPVLVTYRAPISSAVSDIPNAGKKQDTIKGFPDISMKVRNSASLPEIPDIVGGFSIPNHALLRELSTLVLVVFCAIPVFSSTIRS